MKGYKATDKNGKCRDFQFKEGKTYTIEGELSMCGNGFHFCQNFFDVYNYYTKNIETRVFEIQALGKILTESDKSCTDSIKLVKELSKDELLDMFMNKTNSGDWNSGNRNSGDWNSGNWNSGDGNSGYGNSGYGNSGDWNSGNRNSGNRNSGNRNSGYGNSGNRNSGDWNSGYGNSGNRNSGDWNSGDGNSGYFNNEIPLYFFNKPSNMKYSIELENKLRGLNVKPILTWIYTNDMTEEEKTKNPSHIITGGFLRKTDRMDWSQLTNEDKEFVRGLPNFDDAVFQKISGGVSLLSPKTIKVNYNGQDIEIDLDKAKELGIIK